MMKFVCLIFVLMIVQVVEGTSCSSCDVLATCFSLLIDHYCKCNQGYIGSGITCSDFDECSARPSRCHVNANCSNSIGSYSCACAVGYQGDGVNYCDALPDSITIPVTSTTSELMTSLSLAPTTSSTSKPTTSSIKVNERFTTTGVSDECTTLPAKCHVNAECSNSIGSYKCTCKPGYYGDGVTSCRGYCDEANVTIDDKILHFPQTWVDVETMSSNKCSNGRPLASIYCRKITSLSPNFDASTAVFVSCDVTIHNLTTKIDWKNLESESDKLRLMTSHLTMLTSSVVENVIGFLDDVSYAAKANNTLVSPNTLINIVETSDVISGSLNHSTVTNVVQSLHTIATYVTLDEGESQVQVATSNVAVKVSQSDFNISDVSYHPVFPQTTGISLSPVDVMLPAEVYKQAMNDVTHSDVTPVRTIFIVHHDPDATNTSGWIVTASVSDVTISNLSRPVTYTINAINSTNQKRAIPESLMVLETHLKCVYLDDNGDWSDVGLCRIRGTTTCQSNHLTSFSIIISHTKVHGDVTLSIISTIGCVTSIVCLVITIILHLHNKKLRSLRPTKIFLNVTLNLALFYVIFTMGVSRTDNDDVCTAVAMTMHYVILVTWMWMVVYSFNIYTAVAMMFSKEMTILQAAIFAYLLPVAIVGATSGASIAFPTSLPVDEDRFCDSSPPTIYENFTRTYRSQDKCWIHEGALLYGFLLPVGVCYVTCVILFIMTMQKILKKQVKKKKRSYHRERYIAVTMATMFGVTWVFGYVILVVNDPLSKSVTSWLFAVTSSIQGVMIFILMGWRKPEFRQLFPSLSLKSVGATMRGLVGKKGGYDVNNSFITSAADIAVTATDGDVTNTTVVSVFSRLNMKYLLLATLLVLYLAALAETSVVDRKLRVQQFEKDSDVTEDYELKRKVGLLFLRKILGQGDILRPEKEKELDRLVEQSGMTCTLCKAGVDVIQKLLHSNGGEDVITAIAVEVCELGNIEDRRVCKLAVEEFKQEVFYVLFNLQPDELCYWLMKNQCRKPADFLPNWVVTSSSTPQPPYKPRTNPASGTPTLKFLFFTDMHMDVRYAPGRTAKCREPLCCRDNDALPDQESDAAGMWGDYRHCDMPQNTVESMMSQVANNDGIDFIIFTGDIPAHNVWNQTKEDQIDKLQRWTDLLKKHFPTTPVYAAVGNHESAPVNSYPPHSIFDQPGADTQWLLDTLYDSWSNWIPEEDMGFVKQGAFYTTLIRPGLRVVSLNTNYCSDDSWWLLVGTNAVDPEGQLKWFAGVMQAAEDNDENVLIISHRPTDGCMKPWSDNYYEIINRYQNTIIAQLFGHAHTDEMMLYYDITQEDRVSAIGLIGPGFTTYSNLNSGYRIYTMEGEYEGSRYSLLDGESYYLNITDANMRGEATWQREYSFVDDYDVINLTPPELKKLVDRFDSDEQLFQSYHNHITKMEDLSDCDVTCKQSTLCDIKTFRADDNSFC